MKTVVLQRSGLQASALGLGTALLMNRIGRRSSLRLLETAFENGITHFDTAPLYGYGEAESVVGEFARRRRQEVTIATKFGIEPPRRTAALRAGKAIARALVRMAPSLRGHIGRSAAGLVKSAQFDVKIARRSLERSLRELRTGYIDVFLLHECRTPDLKSEGLLDLLESWRIEGTIRAFGIATDAETVVSATASRSPYAHVVQFPQRWQEPTRERIDRSNQVDIITHSVVGRAPKTLSELLDRNRELRERFESALFVSVADLDALARLLIAHALDVNESGIVLVGSTSEHHIRRNARVVSDQEFGKSELQAFSHVLDALRAKLGTSDTRL